MIDEVNLWSTKHYLYSFRAECWCPASFKLHSKQIILNLSLKWWPILPWVKERWCDYFTFLKEKYVGNGRRQKTLPIFWNTKERKNESPDTSCLNCGHFTPTFDINIPEEISIILWSPGAISLPVQVIHHSEGWADNRNVRFIYRCLPVEEMTVILKLLNILLDVQDWVDYLPRFPFWPGFGQHPSFLRQRAKGWQFPFELSWVGICVDLWLSSDICAWGGRVGRWGPRLFISVSDMRNAVYFAISPPP